MYCPNCNKEYDGKFCPECGTKLIEKPSAGVFNINLGDANAISDGITLHDSHNVNNVDNSVHNTSTVAHVTNVAAQKTDMELLQEKKSLYLNECKRAYEDNVLDQAEVIALEEYRIKIGLNKATADSILESVRIISERNAMKTSLNPIAKTKLKILTENLQKNEVKALMDQIDGLEALVNKYEHDELSRKYFLVLAALKPEKCINLKENSKVDSYWKSFWSYLAYLKVGKFADAENVLVSLDRFVDYPEDNMTVLAVAGALVHGKMAEAEEYLDSVTGDYTPALQRFVDSIYLLLAPELAKEMNADANSCAFYLVNFFNQDDPKERIHQEAEERRLKTEDEVKRKAEDEVRRKSEQEAKRKAEEDTRHKENDAKAPDEARSNASTEEKCYYDVVLKSSGDNKLQVLKVVMETFALSLKEGREKVDGTPCVLVAGVDKVSAEVLKKVLEKVGGEIELVISSNIPVMEESSKEKLNYSGNAVQDQVRSAIINSDTPETIVDGIIANMVGGFENVNVFSKNDKYKVCKYPVTQHEWEIIMGSNPSFEKSPNYPVVDVTYQEAEDFVRRVNTIASKKGYEFMIPNREWQWLGYQKKCAEAFKHLDKPILKAGVSAFAWHELSSGGHLHDVGKLKSTCGIYDACGLVYEMCQTKKYNSYHYGAFNESIDHCFGNKYSELMYVDKRYDNLGLRLICLE